MRWTVAAKLVAGFGLALLILLSIGIVAYQAIGRLMFTSERVAHTHEVLTQLELVLGSLKDAETGQRGYLLTGVESYLEPYDAANRQIVEHLGQVEKLTADNPNQQVRLPRLRSLVGEKLAELSETIELRKSNGFNAALELVLTDTGKRVMDDIRKVISEMAAEEHQLLEERQVAAQRSADTATLTILIGTIAAFFSLALVAYIITKNITTPLQELTQASEKIAARDLSVTLSTNDRKDEVGTLMLNFAQMVKNLRQMIGELDSGVTVIYATAQGISQTMPQLASSASQTAASITETSTTAEELKQTAHMSRQKAESVSASAQAAVQTSKTGQRAVEETMEGMNQVRQQMETIAEGIMRLSEQSQAIGEIVASVNDLAEQSNLLAVNAAIEAARAGEQGKGFTVVAEEVRNLAEQSKQATAQVRGKLNDIQKATGSAVMATEQGHKVVEAGVKQAALAGEGIRRLGDSVAEAAQAASLIAALSEQQLTGVEQVTVAMEEIKEASQQNLEVTRQVEEHAGRLHTLGEKMQELVRQYRLQ